MKKVDVKSLRMVTITPEKARKMIERSTPMTNRGLNKARVAALARVIKAGGWVENGETIIVDSSTGVVVDGQHRLHAISESGVTVRCAVATVNSDRVETIRGSVDQGVCGSRTASQELAMRGVKSAALLAATARLVWKYRRGINIGVCGHDPMAVEVVELAQSDKSIADSVALCSQLRADEILATVTPLAFFHNVVDDHSKDAAETYLCKFMGAIACSKTDPAYLARKTVQSYRMQTAKARRGLDSAFVAALVVKGWNATRSGFVVKSIRWNKTEEFPRISGSTVFGSVKID